VSRLQHLLPFSLTISICLAGGVRAELTLIQRSNGLGYPEWEEGHTELELGDANGDGQLDILSVGDHGNPLVNSSESGIMCWLGDGEGNWQAHQSGHFGYGGTGLGDLDRDGRLDIAWGVHHDWGSGGFGDRLLGAALGDGSGAVWTLATGGEDWGMFSSDLADFDGDGWLDLISQSFGGSNGIRVYRNHGDGTWSQAYTLAGGSVRYTIETGDFNADGYLDFACTRSGGTVYLGDGDFGFSVHDQGLGTASVGAVDVGDFDGDGHDDLVLARGSAGVHAYRYEPASGSWVDLSNGLPSGSAEQVQLGDLNGDGYLDIVTFYRPTGRTFLGDGAGNWVADATWVMPSPGDGNALRVDGDVDHDGREDILVLAERSGFPFYRNQLRCYSPWLEPGALSARVVSPAGGEALRLGSIRKLRWLAAVPPGQGPASVTIWLSTQGGNGPWTLVATGLPDNGYFEWHVAGQPSEQCRLKVHLNTATDSVSVYSPADFSIAGDVTSVAGWQLDAGGGAGWLRSSPSPTAQRATLYWSRPTGQPAADQPLFLSIYSADGRRVDRTRLDTGPGNAGEHVWLPAAELPAGTYFARIESGGWQRVTKLTLLR
jgi:hypothetical protein